MKKLLGLLAVAPMALAACGTEEKVYAEVAGTAYGSSHGSITDGVSNTGIAKAVVTIDADDKLDTIKIDETQFATDADGNRIYVWSETVDTDKVDADGFRLLKAQEAGEAMADFGHDLVWKYGVDYMPVVVTPESSDGADDAVIEAQGWTKTMDALIAVLENKTYTEALTQHAIFAQNMQGSDWTSIVGASNDLVHIAHYSAVILEAFKTAIGE